MSYFDPYYLYSHPQRKSHKGQVIQKKPTDVPFGINDQDLKKAITVLTNYGYYISRNPPPSYPNRQLLTFTIQAINNTAATIHEYSVPNFIQIDNSLRAILLSTYTFLSSLDSVQAINILIQVPYVIIKHAVISSSYYIHFIDQVQNKDNSIQIGASQGPVYSVIRSANSTGTSFTFDGTYSNLNISNPFATSTMPLSMNAHVGAIVFNAPVLLTGDQANQYLNYLKNGSQASIPTTKLITLSSSNGNLTQTVATACISVEIIV